MIDDNFSMLDSRMEFKLSGEWLSYSSRVSNFKNKNVFKIERIEAECTWIYSQDNSNASNKLNHFWSTAIINCKT